MLRQISKIKNKYLLLAISFLLVVLLASIGLNMKLISRNRQLTQTLTWVRLDPIGIDQFEDESLPNIDNGTTSILFFGDSRAVSWPAPNMDNSYSFTNRGIGGQTSAQTVERFEAHVVPVQPDVVVVQVCVNELWRVPVFPEHKDEIIAACEENLLQIVEESNNLGATVLLTTVFPVKDPPLTQRTYWSSDVYEAIDTVNETILSLEGEDVLVLDAYELLADENGRLQDQYAVDFLHINEAGYQVLNDSLVTILESMAD